MNQSNVRKPLALAADDAPGADQANTEGKCGANMQEGDKDRKEGEKKEPAPTARIAT